MVPLLPRRADRVRWPARAAGFPSSLGGTPIGSPRFRGFPRLHAGTPAAPSCSSRSQSDCASRRIVDVEARDGGPRESQALWPRNARRPKRQGPPPTLPHSGHREPKGGAEARQPTPRSPASVRESSERRVLRRRELAAWIRAEATPVSTLRSPRRSPSLARVWPGARSAPARSANTCTSTAGHPMPRAVCAPRWVVSGSPMPTSFDCCAR